MVKCGNSFRVHNPETQEWTWFDNYQEADRAEAEAQVEKEQRLYDRVTYHAKENLREARAKLRETRAATRSP